MTKLNGLLLALCMVMVPAAASAEVSLSELLDVDTTLSLDDESLELNTSDDGALTQCYGGGCRRVVVHHGPRRVVHRRVIRRPVRPVVVVEQPATVVVAQDPQPVVTAAPVAEVRHEAKFGFGIRGMGLKQSPAHLVEGNELSTELAGGIGYYFKYRPIRWVSLEFQNDFMFGKFENAGTSRYQEFFRVPLSLGLQIHFLDYGLFDIYAAAAASVAFVTLDDGNDSIDQEIRYPQFGGSFGLGVSFIAGVFEIGIDVRYTIDEAPDEYDRMVTRGIDQDKVVHGVVFGLNVGFAL